MLSRLLQPKNVSLLIRVTPPGISILLRLVQFIKAFEPIFVTVSGITISERLEQPLKVKISIRRRFFERVIVFKFTQYSKAQLLILLIVSGRTIVSSSVLLQSSS